MHTLAGWRKSSGETRRIKMKKMQKTPTILRLRSGPTKGNKLRENPLPKTIKNWRQQLACGASSSVDEESQKDTEATWGHHLQVSPHTSHYTEAVFSMIREIYGRKTWRSYERFGRELGNLENVNECHSLSGGSSRKKLWSELKICEESSLENCGTAFQGNRRGGQWSDRNHWHNFQDLRWMSASLLHSRAYQYFIAKACVFSDSVLFFGKMADNPVESWRRQIQWYSDNNNMSKNWIELMDYLWNSGGRFSQDSQQWEFSIRFNRWWENYSVNQRTSWAGSSSCQCLTTWCGMQKRKWWIVLKNAKTIKEYAEIFLRCHWSFLAPGSEKKWYGTCDDKPDGFLDRTLLRGDSGHPIFRCTSALERGDLRSKGGGKTSVHFNGSTKNIELLFQVVISVNEVSIDGAVADMIEESPVGQRAPGKQAASGQLDEQEIITQSPFCRNASHWRATGKHAARIRATIWKVSEDQKLSKLCSEAGLRLVEIGQSFASRSRRNSYWRVEPKQCTIWTCLGHKSLQLTCKKKHWSRSSIFVERSNRILDSNSERFCQICQRSHVDPKRKRKLRENPQQKRDQY